MRRSFFQLAALTLLLAALLAGCGNTGYSQTADTASYKVQLSLDGTDFGQHTATITVQDKSGSPAAVDSVTVAPIMEAMGMTAPEQTAKPLGEGRYQAQGEFFSMIGEWEFDVRVAAAGKEELARFKVPVNQQ
jgi:ABC-type phosphate transport system substrate-binding protein